MEASTVSAYRDAILAAGDPGQVRKSAVLLLDSGCCPRCCLRYFGIRTTSLYLETAPSSAELSQAIGHQLDSKAPPLCTVCLGSLQLLDPAVASQLKYNQKGIEKVGAAAAGGARRVAVRGAIASLSR